MPLPPEVVLSIHRILDDAQEPLQASIRGAMAPRSLLHYRSRRNRREYSINRSDSCIRLSTPVQIRLQTSGDKQAPYLSTHSGKGYERELLVLPWHY